MTYDEIEEKLKLDGISLETIKLFIGWLKLYPMDRDRGGFLFLNYDKTHEYIVGERVSEYCDKQQVYIVGICYWLINDFIGKRYPPLEDIIKLNIKIYNRYLYDYS